MTSVYGGLLQVAGRMLGASGILAYHGVGAEGARSEIHLSPEAFQRQLDELATRYEFVGLEEYLGRVEHGRSVGGLLALTFDDAYLGVCRYVTDVLAVREIPATVFVATHYADRQAPFWWDAAEGLLGDDARRTLAKALGCNLQASAAELRARVFRSFAGRFPGSATPLSGDLEQFGVWRSASFDELSMAAKRAPLQFGLHTHTHPVLPLLPPDEQVREIEASGLVLRERLGGVVPVLAYPYGMYDRATASAARSAGAQFAVTIEPRRPIWRDFPMTIPRLCMQHWTPPTHVSGCLNWAHWLPRVARHGEHPRRSSWELEPNDA